MFYDFLSIDVISIIFFRIFIIKIKKFLYHFSSMSIQAIESYVHFKKIIFITEIYYIKYI